MQAVGIKFGVFVAADAVADGAAHAEALERGGGTLIRINRFVAQQALQGLVEVDAQPVAFGQVELEAAGEGFGQAGTVGTLCGEVDFYVALAADVAVAEQVLHQRADVDVFGVLLEVVGGRGGVGHADAAFHAAVVKFGTEVGQDDALAVGQQAGGEVVDFEVGRLQGFDADGGFDFGCAVFLQPGRIGGHGGVGQSFQIGRQGEFVQLQVGREFGRVVVWAVSHGVGGIQFGCLAVEPSGKPSLPAAAVLIAECSGQFAYQARPRVAGDVV